MWNLEQYKDSTVIIDDNGKKYTYLQINAGSSIIAKAIGRRCLVFSLCENSVGSVEGYISFINNRIVPILLNRHIDRELLDNLSETYCPEYLWVPESMACSFGMYEEKLNLDGYVLLKTAYNRNYPLADDLCLLLTTSGSTGSPKLVRQSYENVKSNALSIVEYLELSSKEKPISTLPMNYTYGLSIINSHLFAGATLLLTDKGLMQKEFWSFFKDNGATSFGGVPYTYEMLDKLRFYRMQLPSLRYMTQAGGKLTPELHRKFAEYAQESKKKFIVMYGQCEATARMGYLPAEKSLEKCGSAGIAIPGGKFYLIDENGNRIDKPFVTGELVYEGPNVTLGYAECGEDLTKGDERNGVLQTGDMAQFDNDNYYYIVGRKKRFLKIYGNRVNLDEIDRLIKARFDNIDVASAGVDDHMFIFITDEQYRESVCKFAAEKTNLNSAAFKAIVIDAIPKNDAGKTLYNELAKYYWKNDI